MINRESPNRIGPSILLAAWLLANPSNSTAASGIFRDGAGARAMALGGASTGQPDQPLEALHANPAGLSLLDGPTLQLGLGGAVADGEFSNAVNANGSIRDGFGVWPEAALAYPLESIPVTLGIAFIPDAILGAKWNYVDAQGAGGTNYGAQGHQSEIVTLRSTFGASVQVCESLSFGASVNAVYNRNKLQAPYIFQNYPGLQGFKTLLDLETDGFGVNGMFGLVYRPCDSVNIGLSYQTEMRVNSKGDAFGNAGRQLTAMGLGGAQPDFHYDAEVVNVFPQTVSGGLSWQMCPRARALFQVDWINWSDSFDDLNIYLRNGSNGDINGVLNTPNIYDVVPLEWRDQFVYRFGLEYQATDEITLRAGYAYGRSPVPDHTLLPLTAAIMEHKVTAGLGWENGRYGIDLAYQYDLPASQSVDMSALAGGEYSNSRTEVSVHWFALTGTIKF